LREDGDNQEEDKRNGVKKEGGSKIMNGGKNDGGGEKKDGGEKKKGGGFNDKKGGDGSKGNVEDKKVEGKKNKCLLSLSMMFILLISSMMKTQMFSL